MKPEELRIGNWVRHYSSWSYRQPNQGPMEEFDFQWDDSDWYAMGECTMEIDKIKPIPITEEWLLKFGFTEILEDFIVDRFGNQYEKHRIFSQTGKGWDGFNVHFVKSSYGNVDEFGIVARNDGDILINVEHIHQLQNLYYALTGKELIVK